MSTSSVETTQLPRDITKRLPRYNALPTVLIGRLAIDRNYGGQGLGRLLLADAIKRCFKLSSEVGIAAVIVDAKDETAATFYEHFGFRRFADFPLKLYMPMAEIRQLMDEGR